MNPLTILITLALIVTIATLFTGILSMGHGGEFDEKHSTQLMAARVGSQGVLILLLIAALYFANS
ncbi:MAG: twin transmembrane helix small protein [Gammaproteobacteria bacterium]